MNCAIERKLNEVSEMLDLNLERLKAIQENINVSRVALEKLPCHKTSEEFNNFLNWCDTNKLSPNEPINWKAYGIVKK